MVELSELNIDFAKENFNEDLFGEFNDDYLNPKLSKCLYKNNSIIGCYLIGNKSMVEMIKYIHYWVNQQTYKDLKFFVTKEQLNTYKHKKGIFGKFIYINKKYRGKHYANLLIDYSKTLGDYNYGVTVRGVEDYWIKKHDRIKICEWTELDGSISILTASKLC